MHIIMCKLSLRRTYYILQLNPVGSTKYNNMKKIDFNKIKNEITKSSNGIGGVTYIVKDYNIVTIT